ncbi:MAG TPA: helix-turn-helix domain-containing protein [Puia sp.]|jgi:DNA-binding HxlR family transcriptional regulator|nr:helix-turn-helix domain-containing protein [Puia sp.]
MTTLKIKNGPDAESQCKSRLHAIADALYAIGGKWKLRIIVGLLHGTKRFNELQRLIDGISAKVLSSELKELEINGFVKRKVLMGTPVIVEYELTKYADTLSGVLDKLSEWGAMHRDNVRKSMKKKKTVEAYPGN